MADKSGEDRHSKSESPELINDPQERAAQEARNALVQFDTAREAIESWLNNPGRQFKLRPSLIQSLHRCALQGISMFAGNWRPAGVEINLSSHEPPEGFRVAELVENMCDYVNENWGTKSAVHLASYLLWQLNWIHPFDDGNGRTARAISYVVLCVRSNLQLPGNYTIPEQIAENKQPYYEALEAADARWKEGQIDVTEMENLMEDWLAKQLASVLDAAKSDDPKVANSAPTLH